MLISVIIPVYNSEKYLEQALQSIHCANADTEIIIIDDGSNDNSVKIAQKYTDKIIPILHSGPVHARNTGIKAANGDFILFLDSDDTMTHDGIDCLFNNIDNYDIAVANRKDFISPDCSKKYELHTSSGGVISGCAIFHRNVFDKIGLFDTDLLCGDGFEWLIRAKKANLKIKNISYTVCNRRLHDSNMGLTMADQEKSDYCKIIRKHFTQDKK